ncbi:MAG: acetate--CoA ligase [candidate division FCPU426 bacterium]
MPKAQKNLSNLLVEKRKFKPSSAFVKQANINDPKVWAKAAKDPDKFWAGWADQLQWIKPYKKVSSGKMPRTQWFTGGKLNASANCLDRHLDGARRYKAAIIWQGENGDSRILTYWQMTQEVARFANLLKKSGVKKGDRVAVYMGMIPELPIAALACARIGAVHSVIFGGFSPASIRDRVNDMQAKLLVCADGSRRKGGHVDLKKNVDEALENGACPSLKTVIVFEHVGNPIQIVAGRDIRWKEAVKEVPAECEPEAMDSEDTLFLLYTSGSTGKPKGIQHSTAGYLTGTMATHKWVFDVKESDLFWCTADVGWITGHSYLTYGPLLNGASCFIYEGTPDYPTKDIFWQLIEKWGVTIFYTAPTAIRAFMQWGDELIDGHALGTLRLLGSVGEPINPEAWIWYHEHVGKKRCPIVDTWWQTETGSIMITPLPALVPTTPGSATRAFPGTFPEVVDDNGKAVKKGGGYLVYKKPWPSMLRTIWGDDPRFLDTYFSRFPGAYFAGDAARLDGDGNFWLMGRVDDVVNVSGHRIGTMEVESALVDHPAVAEAAVIGRDDALKGQALAAFVILKSGHQHTDQLKKELREHVGKVIGPIAKPDDVVLTPGLPKTRSGKIMRRLLRDIAEGRTLGDVTTLADPGVVEHLKGEYAKIGKK